MASSHPPPPPPPSSPPSSAKTNTPSSSNSSNYSNKSKKKTKPQASRKHPATSRHPGDKVWRVKEPKYDKEVSAEESSQQRHDDEVVSTEESSQQRNDANVETKDSVICYDICPPNVGLKLNPSLLDSNKGNRKDRDRTVSIKTLRPGMILLKQFLSLKDQVEVIRKCRELGVGPGGFYQPGYEDGAKMRLRMMCLGKNWDPETSKYSETRAFDGAKAPPVPEEFLDLVQRAISDSHEHLVKNNVNRANVEKVLPSMKPDLCIVNFYSKTGRLGLHQDKDESRESLDKGLPVVSFSIGDSAEFLYGDTRNVDKVKDVVLESGDVLIFGGKARHVFHGVSAIFPDSASKSLSAKTNIRPGRLNLTFRQY